MINKFMINKKMMNDFWNSFFFPIFSKNYFFINNNMADHPIDNIL